MVRHFSEPNLVIDSKSDIPTTKATDSKAAATKDGSSAKVNVTVVEPKKAESGVDSDDDDMSILFFFVI